MAVPHFGDASCRVIGGYDFVGDLYDGTSTDHVFNPVPAPDSDPAPCNPLFADARVAAGDASSSGAGHGTHVAGIIGAKAADANGVTGVAPDVRFLAYRVFGCNGGVDNDIIVAALERAYRDGAQVVNMSIGDDYASWPEEPTAQASDELVRNGVVVAVAMGNAGGVVDGAVLRRRSGHVERRDHGRLGRQREGVLLCVHGQRRVAPVCAGDCRS